MIVKLLYFGEGVTIPYTTIGMGVSTVSIWVDGVGYTSASNNVGALGYTFLNTPETDVGEPATEAAAAFNALHGQLVTFEISPNVFVSDGGIARVKLSVLRQDRGAVKPVTLEFTAQGCTGVSAMSNTISFTAELLQLERSVAEVDESISDDDVASIVDSSPNSAVA